VAGATMTYYSDVLSNSVFDTPFHSVIVSSSWFSQNASVPQWLNDPIRANFRRTVYLSLFFSVSKRAFLISKGERASLLEDTIMNWYEIPYSDAFWKKQADIALQISYGKCSNSGYAEWILNSHPDAFWKRKMAYFSERIY
jgi:hypothetical protein